MNKKNFEWDGNKQKINIEKHGIDFIDAIAIFSTINRIEKTIMHESGEERCITICEVIRCSSLGRLYCKRQVHKTDFSAEGK